MKRNHLSVPLAVSLVAGIVSAASAVVVPGGGPKKSDCYVGAEVEGVRHSLEAATTPTRVDQKACNGSCTFSVKECINEPVAGCTAQSLTGLTITPATISAPPIAGGTMPVCGDVSNVCVLQQGNKKGKAVFRIVATNA